MAPCKLILFFDGTNDNVDEDPTNVLNMMVAVQNDLDKGKDRDVTQDRQKVLYQPGIGTTYPSRLKTIFGQKAAMMLDSGFAIYLEDHICQGYKWLAQEYKPGDEIYLFGFSRGAYTARCLAGMINKVGIIKSTDKDADIHKIFKLYADTSDKGIKASAEWKKREDVSEDAGIKFVGVWDTVASVGLIRTAHLPFASSNKIIHTFRHALALDERRARFKANLWHHTGDAAAAAVLDPESATATRDKGLIQKELEWGAWLKSKVGFKITEVPAGFAKKQEDLHPESLPINEAYAGRKDTDVKEVWFPGCHADVGGGSQTKKVTRALNGPSLRWMIEQVMAKAPLAFKSEKLNEYGLSPEEPRYAGIRGGGMPSGSNMTMRDFEDAKSEVVDQLNEKKAWRILEYLPIGKSWADADGDWKQKLSPNNFAPRKIRQPKGVRPIFHYSVGLRMAVRPDYVPKTEFINSDVTPERNFTIGEVEWDVEPSWRFGGF